MAEVPTDLKPNQQRFADLIIAGVPGYKAYTQAGYTAKSDKVASAGAARLLGSARIAAYIDAVSTKAVEVAVVSRSKVLQVLMSILESVRTPASERLKAADQILTELHRLAPIENPIEVLDTTATIDDCAALSIAIGKATAAGRLSPQQGIELATIVRTVTETIVSARLTLEDAGIDPDKAAAKAKDVTPEPAAKPAEDAAPKRSRPVWLKGPGKAGGEGK